MAFGICIWANGGDSPPAFTPISMFFSRVLVPAVAGVLLLSALPLAAQMQLHARLNGELLPVATVRKAYLNVLQNGKKQSTRDMEYHVRAHDVFGEGFVEIRDIVTDLDPLRNASIKERTHPSAVRVRYEANLVADRSLADCYALLTFTTQGSVGTHLIPVGSLSAGKPKKLEIELRSQIDSIGTLHVFSEALELRSTQRPEAYDLLAHYRELVKDMKGLAAAELTKFEDNYPHELSADGRLLVSLRKRDAKKVMVVYDLASMKLLCETTVAETDDFVAHLTWVSDHEVAYVAEDDYRDTSSEYKLHLLDARTGETRKLLDDVFGIIHSLPDKPEVLVLVGGRWADATFKFDVHTRKSFDLEEPASGYYLFDRAGAARVRVKFERDKSTYSFRATADARWRELDDSVKEPGLRFNLRSADLLDRVADVHSVGPDGDTLYISTRLGTDRFELAAFSMAEGVIKRTIARHPRYDLSIRDGGLARLLFAKDSTTLLGMIYEGQKPQVVWLDPRYAAVQKAVDQALPGQVNLPIDWSRDGGTFIFLSASDRDPGTFYVFRPEEARLLEVLRLGERLADKSLAKTSSLDFVARDGEKIPAYVTRPSEPASGPRPLVVSVHGGPMARDSWQYDSTNQFLASRGYIVLQVNYRGSSGYGAAFQNAGLRARLDTVVLDDIADGVRHLIAAGEVDPARVAVMGASFGGWATYMSLIKYPEMYRAGIAISAVANWRQSLRDDRWRFGNRSAYSFWKTLLNRQNFAEDEKFIDPYVRAAELKQPIFIIHGERDDVVHASEARRMFDALKKHNPNAQAKSFPYATHSYWPFADRVVRLNEIALFLDRHLAPPLPSGEAVSAVGGVQ